MKATIDIPPAKGLFAQECNSHGLLDAFLGASSVADVNLVGMGLLLSLYPNRPEFVTSDRLGNRPSGNVVGANQGNPKMTIEAHGGGPRLLSNQHCAVESAASILDEQSSFSDELATATQSLFQGQVDEDSTRSLCDFDELLDLPALMPLPPRFDPPVVRLGIDCPPSGVHVQRAATIEEIAAIPDLHERAVACLANNLKADTPEAKLILESVRDEGPFGLFAYHGGTAPPPLPPRPKLKKRPIPKFPKYQLNNLFAPDAGHAAPVETGHHG